jgi:hypothetical protein
MTLSVIGAGFGRTGTRSLKLALEELGLGPCYRMMDEFSGQILQPIGHVPQREALSIGTRSLPAISRRWIGQSATITVSLPNGILKQKWF